MKKGIGLVLALVFTAVPASAQAQYCFGYPMFCQYLGDNGFEQGTTYWEYIYPAGPATVTDQCAGGSTTAPNLNSGGAVSQNFYTDNLPFQSWAVSLDLYKTSTNVTATDYFTVSVSNLTTGVKDSWRVEAASYPGLCKNLISFTTTKDYSNSYVRVRVTRNVYATTPMYVDNVSFFGRMY